MRPIKFRGKRVDNGEWVEGLICYNSGGHPNNIEQCGFDKPYEGVFEVIPETVGQFTGLTDKNGKEIWDGDILQFTYQDRIEENGRGEVKGAVTFENGGFYVKENFPYTYEDEMSSPDTLNGWLKSENCYIIGNIHDNPELL